MRQPKQSDPKFPSPEWWDLYTQAEQLRPLVEANTPEGCKLRLLFSVATLGMVPEDDHPSGEDLNLALRAFFWLPETERRRICNGWHTSRFRTPLKLFHKELLERSRRDVLVIEERRGREPFSMFDFDPTDNTPIVKVVIRFGAIQADALTRLREIVNLVESRWDELICDPDGERSARRQSAEELLAPNWAGGSAARRAMGKSV